MSICITRRQHNMTKEIVSQEQMMSSLDTCYGAAINGLPKTPTASDIAQEYLKKYEDPEIAIKKLVNAQIAKCTTSGFLTSLGGLITLPIAIPANIASVMYVQIRMIAAIATIGGYDLQDDEVQTLIYVCLAGMSISDVCKQVGVQFTNKFTMSMLKKLPGTVLTKINQKVGFRFVTKFGQKGPIHLGKMVPVAGGIVGGGIDFVGTHKIAKIAYKTFILNDLD